MNSKPKIILSVTAPQSVDLIKGQPKYLKSKGFDVYLLCPEGPNISDFIKKEGCTFIPVPYSREINILNDIKCLWLTYTSIKKIKPTIINVGTPKAGLLGVLAGRLAGVDNRIFTLRGIRSTALADGKNKKIVSYMEKITHKLANTVISISPSMADYAVVNELVEKDKVVVLKKASSNGIDVIRFHPSNKCNEAVNDLRVELGINNTDFVIGFVGRVVKSKGIEEVYKAFKKIKETNENAKLLIVGGVEEQGDTVEPSVINEMYSDKSVIMAGRRTDVEFCYQLMDVFTLPSHNFREGFGNVAMEASASGIPIVVSKGGGCQDAVINEQTGKVVAPFSVTQLFESFCFYMDNPDVIKKHGVAGAEYAQNYFKNIDIWDAQFELYKRLICHS